MQTSGHVGEKIGLTVVGSVYGSVVKRLKALDCKSSIRGFKSHLSLMGRQIDNGWQALRLFVAPPYFLHPGPGAKRCSSVG